MPQEPISRRRFVRDGMQSAALTGLSSLTEGEERRPPNVIIMMADDLGYGDVGCFGQKVIKTPWVDRLAAQGIRFTQCYAASTVCAPSRSCMVTGQHTGHTRVRGNDYVPLRPEDPSIGRLMQQAGYRTGIIGKWGLGEPDTTGIPTRQGFDEFFGYLNQVHAHDSFPTQLWRNDTIVPLDNNRDGKQGSYSNDLFLKEALSFVERNRRRPFFLLWWHTIPHAFPAQRQIEVPSIEPIYREKPWPDIEKRFASVVTRMDRDLGTMMRHLNRLGITRDTIILFTSDNGPQAVAPHDPAFFRSSGPLRGVKRDLYEGGICVPTALRWPGRAPSGVVCHEPWAHYDLMATLADIVEKPAPRGTDGVSALPLWQGKTAAPHPPFYWEFHESGFHQAVRMGDWKGVRHGLMQPLELYDLRGDRGEKRNIATGHPEVVARMEGFLRSARTESEEFPIRETS